MSTEIGTFEGELDGGKVTQVCGPAHVPGRLCLEIAFGMPDLPGRLCPTAVRGLRDILTTWLVATGNEETSIESDEVMGRKSEEEDDGVEWTRKSAGLYELKIDGQPRGEVEQGKERRDHWWWVAHGHEDSQYGREETLDEAIAAIGEWLATQ